MVLTSHATRRTPHSVTNLESRNVLFMNLQSSTIPSLGREATKLYIVHRISNVARQEWYAYSELEIVEDLKKD